MRYVIEGVWSGYVSRQSRVVHREVTKRSEYAEAVEKLRSITYTDGTSLALTVRPANPRERVMVNDQYGRLIRDCIRHGVRAVAELPR